MLIGGFVLPLIIVIVLCVLICNMLKKRSQSAANSEQYGPLGVQVDSACSTLLITERCSIQASSLRTNMANSRKKFLNSTSSYASDSFEMATQMSAEARRARFRSQHSDSQLNSQMANRYQINILMRQELKTTKMLIFIVVMFCVSWVSTFPFLHSSLAHHGISRSFIDSNYRI